MEVSGSTSSYQLLQQVNQVQRKEPPSAQDTASKIMESNDSDSDGLLTSSEFNISDEIFSSFDTNSDGSLNSSELEEGISSKLEDLKNQNLTPEDFGSFLSELGLEVPSAPMGGGGGGGSSESEEEFDAADTNEDGTVSAAEQAIYDGDVDQEYTLGLVSTLVNALKDEETDLSQFKEVMSMVNEQFQDKQTKQNLDKYLEYLAY